MFDDTNIDWVLTLKLNLIGPQKASDINDCVERHERRVRREQQSTATTLHLGSSSELREKEKSHALLDTEETAEELSSFYSDGGQCPADVFAELPVAYIRDMEILDYVGVGESTSKEELPFNVHTQTEITAERMDISE